jgi:dTDP-4-amino-4,6-dideoxygalactose transaminase
MRVPLLDLQAQYKTIKKQIQLTLKSVLESQHFILGPEVEALEQEIAAYTGSKYAIGVSSGTDALLLALMSLGISPGDEIITSSFTFFATAGVIHRLGAKPVFIDIDPETYAMDPAQIEQNITEKTKAVIPVHLFGQCAEMDTINALAKKYSLTVVEDAAQAIGAMYKGKRAGALSAMGCFSFFPSKNLGAFGDAGMIVTSTKSDFNRLKILRVHGGEPKYYHKIVGGNFRIDALQAAVLRVKLKFLDEWTEKRQKNAAYYNKALTDLGLSGGKIKLPVIREERHIFNQYVIQVEDRAGLMQHLKENLIGSEIYYPVPLHLQECFSYLGYRKGDLPVCEAAAEKVLALPVYPELTDGQKRHVIDTIARFFKA